MIVLCVLVWCATVLVLARIVLNLVASPPDGVVDAMARGVNAATEPVLAAVRSVVKPVQVGSTLVDLSPWLVVLVLTLVSAAVCR